MNRRDILKRGPLAILGIGAVALGVEAQPEQAKQTVTIVLRPDSEVFRKAVTDAVIGDIRAGGQIREVISNDAD